MSQLLKKCKTPHCRNLHHNKNGYCDECSAKEAASRRFYRVMHGCEYERKERLSASERGYDAAWQKFAREFLQHHPKCAICGKPAQAVDHREMPAQVMLEVYGHFLLDERLYQPLCYSCNRKKAVADAAYIADFKAGQAAMPELPETKFDI